jgi:hypothetical protein
MSYEKIWQVFKRKATLSKCWKIPIKKLKYTKSNIEKFRWHLGNQDGKKNEDILSYDFFIVKSI